MPDPIIEIIDNIVTVSVDEGNNAIINIGLEPVTETVVINNVATIAVEEGDNAVINIEPGPVVETIDVAVVGPQGPAGSPGLTGGQGATGPAGGQGATGPAGGATALSDLTDVDVNSKVNKSVLVWNEATGKFTANDQNTTITLTDGGNF